MGIALGVATIIHDGINVSLDTSFLTCNAASTVFLRMTDVHKAAFQYGG